MANKKIDIHELETLFLKNNEKSLVGKWIHYSHISPLISELSTHFDVQLLGKSELGTPIHSVQFGNGAKRILIWSQMHGNESTGTKAMFDLLNCFKAYDSSSLEEISKSCTVLYIPMLNPDGALNYTRENANDIDLNRDAVALKAIESQILRQTLDDFNPQYCFNLHDQRTIFGVEGTKNPATISLLAPSEETTRTITSGRKATMNVIVAINDTLQQVIPNHIGRYTDEFYPTATGDVFQQLGHNTILIEAGHYPDDYERDVVRKFNFMALLSGLYHIATTSNYTTYKPYFDIPNNIKNFVDVMVMNPATNERVAYQFNDTLVNGKLISQQKKVEKEIPDHFLAHQTIITK